MFKKTIGGGVRSIESTTGLQIIAIKEFFTKFFLFAKEINDKSAFSTRLYKDIIKLQKNIDKEQLKLFKNLDVVENQKLLESMNYLINDDFFDTKLYLKSLESFNTLFDKNLKNSIYSKFQEELIKQINNKNNIFKICYNGMQKNNIKVSEDFSKTLGARTKQDGLFSGEEFREKFLERYFTDGSTDKVIVDLDGTEGYSSAFLEEAFGGLVRKFGKDVVKKRIDFIASDEPLLLSEINEYIENADRKEL